LVFPVFNIFSQILYRVAMGPALDNKVDKCSKLADVSERSLHMQD
jgi:hypothetical protein